MTHKTEGMTHDMEGTTYDVEGTTYDTKGTTEKRRKARPERRGRHDQRGEEGATHEKKARATRGRHNRGKEEGTTDSKESSIHEKGRGLQQEGVAHKGNASTMRGEERCDSRIDESCTTERKERLKPHIA